MELAYSATVAVLLIIVGHSNGVPGDPVMYLPALELRTIDADTRFYPNVPFINTQLKPQSQTIETIKPLNQLQIVPTKPPAPQIIEKPQNKKHNFTFNDFVEALNRVEDKGEDDTAVEESRAARDPSPYPSYPSYPSYGYGSYGRPNGYAQRPPSYGPWQPQYQEAAYVPPTAVHHSSKKPEFLKPFSTKVAGKVSGLIGLVLGLLTGSSGNLELHGFKDILINGIVKPLLVAKGGVKSLISKLAIPVISLLLINLEVLITIWWLWEDCPEPTHEKPSHPTYSYNYPKPSYNYNSYR